MGIFLILLIIVPSCKSGNGGITGSLKSELDAIDKLIKELPEINRQKQKELDSVANLFEASEGRVKIERSLQLAESYRLYNADSSLYYSTIAVELAKKSASPSYISMALSNCATTLATLGLFSEGEKQLQEAAKLEPMDEEARKTYYYAGRTLYGYLVGYLNNSDELIETPRKLYREYDDSLIALLPSSDPFRQFLIGEKYSALGKYQEALKTDEALIKLVRPDSRIYAMTAFQVAMVYRSQGENEKMASYLAKASIADLKNGVRDGLALPMLATYLYKEGDVDQAYRYINISLQEASNGGIRWRASLISSVVPAIDDAYHHKITDFQRKLLIYSCLITLIMIVVVVLLVFVYRQHKKLHHQALLLDQKAKLQTSYIGNFVAMCASYAERLNHLSGIVDRKLAAGEIESLKKMIKNGQLLDSENDDFYKIFDSAFLDIYPDFVAGLNDLLQEDKRINWKKGNPLPPDIRIYALVRLGVNEGTRIAQILQYSVSTVYAYRNRMRNRALNRDEFEHQITQISRQSIPAT